MGNDKCWKEVGMLHEVVAAIIVRSRQVLLGQRSASREFYPGVWDIFGGHVEPGEEKQEALIRELQEEIGITPTRWIFLETVTVPPSSQSSETVVLHLYRVEAWTGTPQNLQTAEHSTIGWFTLEETAQLSLAFPDYPMLFARYIDSDPNGQPAKTEK